MISKALRIAYLISLAALVGCASLAPLLSQPTPAPTPFGQVTSTPQPVLIATQTALPTTNAMRILRIWLPPRFDPNADTASAKLLKQRLADFEISHPRLKIEVRVKAEVGETSLLNSLSITSAAAPKALPDLIALSRSDLEAAVLKGLIHPIDGLSTALDDPNWYPYARELGHVQNIGYGLPFAGDALVLVHRPELKLTTWEDILSSKEVLVFPASDPQELLALSLYISAGGKLVNEQGLPTLEEKPLTQVLTLIHDAAEAQVLLPALVNYETGAQALQAYHDERATLAIAWAADGRNPTDAVQLVPSLSGTPHTFATGWIWALAGSDPEIQQVATELAEYLVANDFVDGWLKESGYLPMRISQNSDVSAILDAAHAVPTNDVLSVLGPIMHQALTRILNGDQVDPVVRSVMEQFK
jgi:ABC-type glycerol-3-phosphate transport system substrate-binding protein